VITNPEPAEVEIIGDEHRDRIWRDRNGDFWRWYQDDGIANTWNTSRAGWQYQTTGERWRFGGMHIPNCGPYTYVSDNRRNVLRQVWETEYGQVSVHGSTVSLDLQRFSDLEDEPGHLRAVAAVLMAAAACAEAANRASAVEGGAPND
jgi:hypothetical protein